MQTINYHGWTVNTEPQHTAWAYKSYIAESEEAAENEKEWRISADTFDEILDMIYERTYDLKTN